MSITNKKDTFDIVWLPMEHKWFISVSRTHNDEDYIAGMKIKELPSDIKRLQNDIDDMILEQEDLNGL